MALEETKLVQGAFSNLEFPVVSTSQQEIVMVS